MNKSVLRKMNMYNMLSYIRRGYFIFPPAGIFEKRIGEFLISKNNRTSSRDKDTYDKSKRLIDYTFGHGKFHIDDIEGFEHINFDNEDCLSKLDQQLKVTLGAQTNCNHENCNEEKCKNLIYQIFGLDQTTIENEIETNQKEKENEKLLDNSNIMSREYCYDRLKENSVKVVTFRPTWPPINCSKTGHGCNNINNDSGNNKKDKKHKPNDIRPLIVTTATTPRIDIPSISIDNRVMLEPYIDICNDETEVKNETQNAKQSPDPITQETQNLESNKFEVWKNWQDIINCHLKPKLMILDTIKEEPMQKEKTESAMSHNFIGEKHKAETVMKPDLFKANPIKENAESVLRIKREKIESLKNDSWKDFEKMAVPVTFHESSMPNLTTLGDKLEVPKLNTIDPLRKAVKRERNKNSENLILKPANLKLVPNETASNEISKLRKENHNVTANPEVNSTENDVSKAEATELRNIVVSVSKSEAAREKETSTNNETKNEEIAHDTLCEIATSPIRESREPLFRTGEIHPFFINELSLEKEAVVIPNTRKEVNDKTEDLDLNETKDVMQEYFTPECKPEAYTSFTNHTITRPAPYGTCYFNYPPQCYHYFQTTNMYQQSYQRYFRGLDEHYRHIHQPKFYEKFSHCEKQGLHKKPMIKTQLNINQVQPNYNIYQDVPNAITDTHSNAVQLGRGSKLRAEGVRKRRLPVETSAQRHLRNRRRTKHDPLSLSGPIPPLPRDSLGTKVPLSVLLEKVREKNRMEYCHLYERLKEQEQMYQQLKQEHQTTSKKSGRDKSPPSCPPPSPTCPPPEPPRSTPPMSFPPISRSPKFCPPKNSGLKFLDTLTTLSVYDNDNNSERSAKAGKRRELEKRLLGKKGLNQWIFVQGRPQPLCDSENILECSKDIRVEKIILI